jgi:NADPH:quinone reductase-like Zn-dependent oxidoreductase
MQVYRLQEFGRIEGLALCEEAIPKPGPTEIVVRVRATSLNRRDWSILQKTYPLPGRPGVVPLSDGAGEVVAVGGSAKRFQPGDRVTGSYFPRWRDGRIARDLIDQLGCTLDGMLAEYVLLDQEWAVRVPDHLTWEEAATLTCAGVTAWNSVVETGHARAGETVLVIGTGGVSLFALQFARMMGCRVIATTSSAAKAERLRGLGAEYVINYFEEKEWGKAVRDFTGGAGADLILDTRGPDTLEQSLNAVALHGRIILLIARGAQGSQFQFSGDAYSRSLATILRIFVGSRTSLEAMAKAVVAQRLRPIIDRVFPFAEARRAYEYFAGGDVFGKVVIAGA